MGMNDHNYSDDDHSAKNFPGSINTSTEHFN